MSDSDRTNELDNYGVWVKKQPRTVSSEDNSADSAQNTNEFTDFSSPDISGGTPFGSSSSADEPFSFDNTEEISLDEFIEDGIFDGDSENKQAEQPDAAEAPAASADVQPESDDIAFSQDVSFAEPDGTISEPAAISEDSPLNIDLSFDDADTLSNQTAEPAADIPGTETIDLSAFGMDFSTSDKPSSSSPAGTEDVNLSDFGIDFSSGSEGEPHPEEPGAPSAAADGMEEISLDSFGFDIDAEESPAENSEQTDEAAAPEKESAEVVEDALSTDSDDDLALTLQPKESHEYEPENSGFQPQALSAQDDDDFDLDSIMSSIEDENGNPAPLSDAGDFSDNESPESTGNSPFIPSEPETAETQTADEIETFNDVVNLEEPIFEETSVDIPEEMQTEETEHAAEILERAADEEPTIVEPAENILTIQDEIADREHQASEPFAGMEEIQQETDKIEMTEEIGFGEPSAKIEEIPVEEAFTTEKPTFEDMDFKNSLESEKSEEEAAYNYDEPDAEERKERMAEKDDEIAAATNSILSQIVSELASLKNEISGLKSDFEELKTKEHSEKPFIPPVEPEKAESGFVDDDDATALSVDELDNILSTAEIVDENKEAENGGDGGFEEPVLDSIDENPVETADEEPSEIDFAHEILQEPEFDEIDELDAQEDKTLPQEILVPKVDDILVESSKENLIEETAEERPHTADTTEEPEPAEELSEEITLDETAEPPELESIFDEPETDEAEPEETQPVDEPFVFDEADAGSKEEPELIHDEDSTDEISPISITETELETLVSTEVAIEDSLTDEKLSYLASDENIDTAPVSSIPGNLQKEIKSVLSYMDQLLENLPEDKIAEFAQSEQFETYKKLFKELGLE